MDISEAAITKLNEVFEDNKGVPLRIIYQGYKAKRELFEGTVLQIYENHSSVHIVGEKSYTMCITIQYNRNCVIR